MVSIAEDDKKINNMVMEVYVSTINSKTRMDQELKSEGQGNKIYIFKNGEDQKINNMDIENTVFSIDSKVSKNAKIRDRYNQKPHQYGSIIYIRRSMSRSQSIYFQNWRKTGIFS